MIVSINPTYYCNFRCNFCYLTEQQLSDRKLLDLNVLETKIKEIQEIDTIHMIDLYGGEIGLLSEKYVNELCEILKSNNIDDINIITNLSMINGIIRNSDFYVTVSYDFDCREQHDRVWNNMLLLDREFSILILASDCMIKKDVDYMINQLNLLGNLKSVEIKPYSSNQANCHNVNYLDFENFIKKWIQSTVEKKFEFVNEINILQSLSHKRNSFSNDHVYITPTGDFAVLEFDINDNEYFKSLNTYKEYKKWAVNEPIKNISDICRSCDYYGTCLTEHYRYVKNLNYSCNGFKGLLDWYKNDR